MSTSERIAHPERPIRVLVVDDDNEICELYAASLEIEGCAVQHVNSGRQALHVLMHRSIDVLVVDLRMEGMSGLVFLEEALKIWPWLGVVISSAFVTKQAVEKAAALGVTRIVEKSPDLRVLFESVEAEAALKRREQTNIPRDHAVDLMRNHLRLLSHLADGKSGADTLLDALLDFGRALSGMLTCDCISILVFQNDLPVMLHMPGGKVASEFLDAVQGEMAQRYEALSGAKLDRTVLQRQVEGEVSNGADGAKTMGSVLSVPVILDDDVCGLLTLASAQDSTYTPSDVSLLYHAANHVSAAFMALRKMQQLAAMDPLTGVYNRIRLEEELERAWLFSRRYGFSMGVVVVDVDNFKTLNDSYDHSVGDEILLQFVKVMRRISRASDIIARYGGDEFVIILPRAEESDAKAFANRLVDGTRTQLFLEKSYRLKVTISVGIATSLNPTGPSTSAELLSQADRALYSAKRAGRDRIAIWPGQDASVSSTDDTESRGVEERGKAGANCAGRIMVVDDEPLVLDVVGRMLEDENYQIVTFDNATDAITEVNAQPDAYDVVLTDLMMPEKSGIELLRELGHGHHGVVKIVMTGYATVDNAISCLREDTYDFIQKPFRKKQLLALIRRAVEYHRLRQENERYQQHLEEMVRERSAQVAASLEEVKRSYEFTLEALVAMLDAREKYTGRHSARVQELSVALGRGMGLTKDELQALASGALLHDIGKIGVPDSVLNRPGKLSADEWRLMQQHPEIGYSIVRSSPYLHDAAEIVRDHHEHYDGNGYLQGLKGEEICLGARIFALVDAYDAIRSNRVYRGARSHEMAVEEIDKNSGTQFDPKIVKVFMKFEGEMDRLWNQVTEPRRTG